MIKLRLNRTISIEIDFNNLLNELNNLNINPELKPYLKVDDLDTIDSNQVIAQQKFDKFSKVSNAIELITLGIDLSNAILTCDKSSQVLESIADIKERFKPLRHNMFSYLKYDGKQFLLNKKGVEYVENSFVKIDGVNEEIYNKIVELHKLLVDNNREPSLLLNFHCSKRGFDIDNLYSKVVRG